MVVGKAHSVASKLAPQVRLSLSGVRLPSWAGDGTVLGLPHSLAARLGVVTGSIILAWLPLLCIHGENGRAG